MPIAASNAPNAIDADGPGSPESDLADLLMSTMLLPSSLSSTRPCGMVAFVGSTKNRSLCVPALGSHVNTAVALPASPLVMKLILSRDTGSPSS